jgi:hypothetical protein
MGKNQDVALDFDDSSIDCDPAPVSLDTEEKTIPAEVVDFINNAELYQKCLEKIRTGDWINRIEYGQDEEISIEVEGLNREQLEREIKALPLGLEDYIFLGPKDGDVEEVVFKGIKAITSVEIDGQERIIIEYQDNTPKTKINFIQRLAKSQLVKVLAFLLTVSPAYFCQEDNAAAASLSVDAKGAVFDKDISGKKGLKAEGGAIDVTGKLVIPMSSDSDSIGYGLVAAGGYGDTYQDNKGNSALESGLVVKGGVGVNGNLLKKVLFAFLEVSGVIKIGAEGDPSNTTMRVGGEGRTGLAVAFIPSSKVSPILQAYIGSSITSSSLCGNGKPESANGDRVAVDLGGTFGFRF